MTTNEKLAEIAGLELTLYVLHGTLKHYIIKGKPYHHYCFEEEWLPRQRIEQAMIVFLEWLNQNIDISNADEWRVRIGQIVFSAGAPAELAEAICTAIEESEK